METELNNEALIAGVNFSDLALCLLCMVNPTESAFEHVFLVGKHFDKIQKIYLGMEKFSIQKCKDFFNMTEVKVLFKFYMLKFGPKRIAESPIMKRNEVSYYEATFNLVKNCFNHNPEKEYPNSSYRNNSNFK